MGSNLDRQNPVIRKRRSEGELDPRNSVVFDQPKVGNLKIQILSDSKAGHREASVDGNEPKA